MQDELSTSILVYDSNSRRVDCRAMALADNLKKIRAEKGMSQQRLAKVAGVSQQLISRLEGGKDETSKHLPKLAAALGVSVGKLDPSYLVVLPSGDWSDHLRRAIKEAVEAEATLQELADVLSDAFHQAVADRLQLHMTELTPVQRRSVAGAADSIAGKKGSSEKSGT
jgi:transcriptional regulator with XRE-family HTH domain